MGTVISGLALIGLATWGFAKLRAASESDAGRASDAGQALDESNNGGAEFFD